MDIPSPNGNQPFEYSLIYEASSCDWVPYELTVKSLNFHFLFTAKT